MSFPSTICTFPNLSATSTTAATAMSSDQDSVQFRKADGIQGRLGLYEVSIDGSTQYMTLQQIQELTSKKCHAAPAADNGAQDDQAQWTGLKFPFLNSWMSGGPGRASAMDTTLLAPSEALDARNFATFGSFVDASPKVYTLEHLQMVWEEAHGPLSGATPRAVSYDVARAEANAGAKAFRTQQGLVGTGAVNQAAHTIAARHVPESGISRAAANAPETFMLLTSHHGHGMSVTVSGHPNPLTPHTAQELIIDQCVENARKGCGGVLTPEAHQAAGAEVRWRLQGTGFDKREADVKRASGLFDEAVAIDKANARQTLKGAQFDPSNLKGSTLPMGKLVQGSLWLLEGVGAYLAIKGAVQDHKEGDTVGAVLKLSTIGPQSVVTVPASMMYDQVKEYGKLMDKMADCAEIDLGYAVGDLPIDDKRLQQCFPYLTDETKRDMGRELFGEP